MATGNSSAPPPVQTAAVVLLYALTSLYVLVAPFTKVEESFNLQATHDLLVLGPAPDALPRFDHLAFPGVVPRTFFGALALALAAQPFRWAVGLLRLPKLFLQLGVRLTLGAAVCSAFVALARATSRRLGSAAAVAALLCCACTPHLLFYASRTLPNTFALYLMLRGCTHWMAMARIDGSADAGREDEDETRERDVARPRRPAVALSAAVAANEALWPAAARMLSAAGLPPTLLAVPEPFAPAALSGAIAHFVVAVVWFRCDMLILLGAIALSWLACRRASLPQLVGIGGAVGIAVLAATVAVDSYFWRTWLWPEGVVLYFNAFENKSHLWGTQPWHWYCSSALPRALLGAAVFVPLGCVTLAAQAGRPGADAATLGWRAFVAALRPDWRVLELLLPALLFVALYSRLPHKEVRFLLPALPLFFLAAGAGLEKTMRLACTLMWGAAAVTSGQDGEGDSDEVKDDGEELGSFGGESVRPDAAAASTTAARRTSSGQGLTGLRHRGSSPTPSLNSGVGRAVGGGRSLRIATPATTSETAAVGTASFPYSLRTPGPPALRLLGAAVAVLAVLALAASAALTAIFVRVSSDNYPGGRALQFLHGRFALELERAQRVGRSGISLAAWSLDGESSNLLPPCPEFDVTARRGSLVEWARECMGKRCPVVPPWAAAATAGVAAASHETAAGRLEGGSGGGAVCLPAGSAGVRPMRVHIDGSAAETGVSRFGEAWRGASGEREGEALRASWIYSKLENLTLPEHFDGFDVLLTGRAPAFHAQRFVEVDSLQGEPRFVWPRAADLLALARGSRGAAARPWGTVTTEPVIHVLRHR